MKKFNFPKSWLNKTKKKLNNIIKIMILMKMEIYKIMLWKGKIIKRKKMLMTHANTINKKFFDQFQ
jgi:hypothetical protein